MKVTQQWLENKIKELNDLLLEYENEPYFAEESIVKQKRNFYVNKLIELEENQLETIKV